MSCIYIFFFTKYLYINTLIIVPPFFLFIAQHLRNFCVFTLKPPGGTPHTFLLACSATLPHPSGPVPHASPWSGNVTTSLCRGDYTWVETWFSPKRTSKHHLTCSSCMFTPTMDQGDVPGDDTCHIATRLGIINTS